MHNYQANPNGVLDHVLQGSNIEFFFNLCWIGLKFGMVRPNACIDGVGEFLESNMTDTNNSSIKNHTYKLINVMHGANVDF